MAMQGCRPPPNDHMYSSLQSTKAQLGKIAEVRGITECSAGQAGELLKAVGWSVERAVDRFYELGMRAEGAPAPVVPAGSGAAKAATGGGASAKAAPTKLESEFKAYEGACHWVAAYI